MQCVKRMRKQNVAMHLQNLSALRPRHESDKKTVEEAVPYLSPHKENEGDSFWESALPFHIMFVLKKLVSRETFELFNEKTLILLLMKILVRLKIIELYRK
jgi:hypothetical protein